MRKVLLDTNAYRQLLEGNETVLEEVAKSDRVYMPVIVLGELFAGFFGGTKERENRENLQTFLAKPRVEIADVTKETAEIFGEIKHKLFRTGTPIPVNDIWIAACAVETGAVLVTYDEHFLKIPGLRIWDAVQN